MKTIKNFYLSLFAVILVSCNISIAQEKLDKYPEPVGGMTAIAKNVQYPELAKKAGIEGTVFVSAKINAQGEVTKTKVLKSDNGVLDKSAVAAVEASKFTPGEKAGKKVDCEITVPIKFKLDGKKKELDGNYPFPVEGMEGLMKNVKYPEDAKKAGIEGKVLVSAVIGKNGDVVSAKILKSDNDLLSAAALEAVKATKFKPAEKDNEKVESEIKVPINFKLDSKK